MRDHDVTRCPSCGAWTAVRALDTTGCPTCARRNPQ